MKKLLIFTFIIISTVASAKYSCQLSMSLSRTNKKFIGMGQTKKAAHANAIVDCMESGYDVSCTNVGAMCREIVDTGPRFSHFAQFTFFSNRRHQNFYGFGNSEADAKSRAENNCYRATGHDTCFNVYITIWNLI